MQNLWFILGLSEKEIKPALTAVTIVKCFSYGATSWGEIAKVQLIENSPKLSVQDLV